MHFHPSAAPSENNVKKPRERGTKQNDTRGTGRNSDTETSPPQPMGEVPLHPGKYVEHLEVATQRVGVSRRGGGGREEWGRS